MPNQAFYKFPSTPYLMPPTDLATHQDRVLSESEAQRFFENEVTVEEKIDGANLGISFTTDGSIRLQNRGHWITEPYIGQWKPLNLWLNARENQLFDSLLDRYILFGEWCYATHSIYYDSLPDWFIAFDIFDKKSEKFLSVAKRNVIAVQAGVHVIAPLFSGVFSKDMLDSYLCKSKYGNEKREGLYFRIDSADFLLFRAKYVRKDFLQTPGVHWSKQELRRNGLCR